MMLAKALLFGDDATALKISAVAPPGGTRRKNDANTEAKVLLCVASCFFSTSFASPWIRKYYVCSVCVFYSLRVSIFFFLIYSVTL